MTDDPAELIRVQNVYKQIRSIAHSTFHAVVVSGFSQSIEPLTSFLKTSKFGGGGVCMALVNQWIVQHSREDSLWNELYVNVSGIPCIRIGVMNRIMTEFGNIAGHDVNPNSFGPIWSLNSELFFMRNGVIPRMNLGKAGPRMTSVGAATGSGGDPALSDRIIADLSKFKSYGRGVGSYATIYIGGSGAHIMCAYLGGTSGGGAKKMPFSDISFFDPNLGEYWFQNADDFPGFLKWVFQMLYGNMNSYQLRCFGKAA